MLLLDLSFVRQLLPHWQSLFTEYSIPISLRSLLPDSDALHKTGWQSIGAGPGTSDEDGRQKVGAEADVSERDEVEATEGSGLVKLLASR